MPQPNFVAPTPGKHSPLSVRAEFGFDGSATASRFPVLAALGGVCRRLFSPALLILVCLLTVSPPAPAATPHSVLVLYSFSRLLPGNIDGDRGLTDGFAARPDLPVAVSAEFLDNPRFSGESYERTFVNYLREKYAAHPPEVIIAAANEAMDFLLRHRAELFAQVPIVHMAVASTYLQSMPPLPPDAVGTPITYDFVGTVEQALRWHPAAGRLVVVTGTSPWDLEWEARMRAQAASLPHGLSIDFLAGLPIEELQQRLRDLPAASIVFTPGFFRDGGGRTFTPREVARLIAVASSVPVYGPFSTFIGTGIVGGRMASLYETGRLGAQTALALLDGASPASLKLPAAMPTPLHVDWRQLKRWVFPRKPFRSTRLCISRNPRSGRPTADRCSPPAWRCCSRPVSSSRCCSSAAAVGALRPRWPGVSNTCASRLARPVCRHGSWTAAPYGPPALYPPRNTPTLRPIGLRTSARRWRAFRRRTV